MLRTVIIGSGSIGAYKQPPYDMPDDNENILSHAHAIKFLSDKFELSCVVDTFKHKAEQAGVKWQVPYSTDLREALHIFKPNIIVVAVPDPYHYIVFNSIFNDDFKPNGDLKLVVLEKPAGEDRTECELMRGWCKDLKIPIVVNYSRMFCKSITDLKETAFQGAFGNLLNVVVRYGRGLKRDGSHSLQLLNYFLGSFINGEIANEYGIIDRTDDDPTYPLNLSFKGCGNVFMVPCDGRVGSVFTHDFWFEHGRIILEDYGKKLVCYKTSTDGIYGSYHKMESEPYLTRVDENFNKNLVSLYENIYEHLELGENLKCTIDDALEVWRILEILLGN